MKALKINESDSTCFEATMSRGLSRQEIIEEWTAVPDCWGHANSVTEIVAKFGSSFICLKFPNGNSVEIKNFTCSSPEEALQEARKEQSLDCVSEDDLEWWQDF